jgi:Zinc-binding loop region of homing endonuclease
MANSTTHEDQNECGCWTWTATTKGRNKPYGKLNKYVKGKYVTVSAHRESAALFLGVTLTPDQTVDHLCQNPMCINPDHMEIVSAAENARRSQMRNSRGFHTGLGVRYGAG